MSLIERRRAIQHLLDLRRPADARAAYYAFDHPESRTTIITHLPDTARAQGYVCLSRTGFDLFRPFVTLRLPWGDLDAATALLYRALSPGMPLIMSAPADYMPLLRAVLAIEVESEMRILALDRGRFQPVINVLVTADGGNAGQGQLPRYLIRQDGDVVASAGVNWQSRKFAEISVMTQATERRRGWGRSVTAALCGHLLDVGRTPLYVVASDNAASLELAAGVGFVDTGQREIMLEATVLARPNGVPTPF